MPLWAQPSSLVGWHMVRFTLQSCWCLNSSLIPLLFLPAAAGGNVIVNTVLGVPPSPFQANKRLAPPVTPGTLSVSHVHLSLLLWLNSASD